MSVGILDGKRIIVTGGGRNIGAEYAKALAREGALVAAADIDGEGALSVAKEIEADGGVALGVCMDIIDEASVQSGTQRVVDEFGGVDVLINNAAVYAGLEWLGPDEVSLSEWDRVMKVNVQGTFVVARTVGQVMTAARAGSIVNIASTTAHFGTPFLLHYAASKGAVITLTRSLAHAYGDLGIRVNTIAPGLIWDKPTLDAMPDEIFGDFFVEQQALKRRQLPSDLVGAVIFFSSNLSAFVTGQTLVVDGGLFMP